MSLLSLSRPDGTFTNLLIIKVTGRRSAIQKKVVVLINRDRACSQIYSGSGGFAKLPQLSEMSGDSVQWVKGVDKDGHDAQVVVTFPQTSNGHVGSPFKAGGNPKFVFTNGDDSGPPNGGPYDVYLYESLTVGGVVCTNPQDPGVIIER